MRSMLGYSVSVSTLILSACSPVPAETAVTVTFTSGTNNSTEDDETANSSSSEDESASESESESETGTKFDILEHSDAEDVDICTARDIEVLINNEDAMPCAEEAPAESFEPVEEWRYPDAPSIAQTYVTPLVINWTDDDENGVIDLCDTPDILTVLFETDHDFCSLHIIDGDYGVSGTVHSVIDGLDLSCFTTPAVGDIDNDGRPEFVSAHYSDLGVLFAIDDDGTSMWDSDPLPAPANLSLSFVAGAVALHDLNGDGSFEILYNHSVFDASGTLLWTQDYADYQLSTMQTTIAADLDGDGDLEVITGYSAHDFDEAWNETTLWDLRESGAIASPAQPHVANFDGDPEPELLFASYEGYLLVNHDGTVVWGPVMPVPCMGLYPWHTGMRPVSINDYDGDGEAEFAGSVCQTFGIYDVTNNGPELLWSGPIIDETGATGTTSFDFLGDATAEPVYADEERAWAWSKVADDWEPRLELPRQSPTFMEFPPVADVDNDGSAEIVVPSADPGASGIVVFGDADSRWIPARRIFNQHSYHITHVNEDGTVPNVQINNWDYFNTFRANSQTEGGELCVPIG